MRVLILALSVLGILISADAAKADRRVAFVVGNGTYKNVSPLPNPPIDAKSMAAVLRNVGFEVVEGTNLTRDKMTERLDRIDGDAAQKCCFHGVGDGYKDGRDFLLAGKGHHGQNTVGMANAAVERKLTQE